MNTLTAYIRSNWHEVPDDVTIPEGVEFAVVRDNGNVFTLTGSTGDVYRVSGRSYTRFTPEPLPAPVPKPTPEDSPIIATGDWDGERLLTWDDGHDAWIGTCGKRGGFIAAADSEVVSWWPAIVAPTGHGVMDDRDKRDRVDATGERWTWSEEYATWGFLGAERRYGTIAAFADDYGPLRFADEVSEA